MSFIVAIDGPSCSGKSTVSNILAKELGFVYVQTGAMYRCVAREILKNSIKLNDIERIEEVLQKINIRFINSFNKQIVLLNGEDVTEEIRGKGITDYTSLVASITEVRRKMLNEQRKMGENSNIVIEGRDIGTNVFPNADIKFFVTAKPIIRAQRKLKELEEIGEKTSLTRVLESVYQWDKDAIERKEGALKRAKDSIYIDTSEMKIEEVKEKMLKSIREKYREDEIVR